MSRPAPLPGVFGARVRRRSTGSSVLVVIGVIALLVVVSSEGSSGPTGSVRAAPFRGSSVSSGWNLAAGSCSTAGVPTPPTWNRTTGTLQLRETSNARECPALFPKGRSGASAASIGLTAWLVVPLGRSSGGTHAFRENWSFDAVWYHGYRAAPCPNQSINRTPARYFEDAAGCEVTSELRWSLYATVVDVTNPAWSNSTSADLSYTRESGWSNQTVCANYSGTPSCTTTVGPSSWNLSSGSAAAGVTGWNGSGKRSISTWTNGSSLHRGDRLELLVGLQVSLGSSVWANRLVSAWTGSAFSAMGAAAGGRGIVLQSVQIS